MKVSELARTAGVSADTVRFYTRAGLLSPKRDPGNGYQHYGPTDLQRLRFARKARQLGFSLKEVTAILGDADRQRSPCPQVRDLFAVKLAGVEQQLLELTELRDHMRAAMQQWQLMPNGTPDGHTICQLIEHWDDSRLERPGLETLSLEGPDQARPDLKGRGLTRPALADKAATPPAKRKPR